MDGQFFILLLAALACPIGMGVMMWWMHRGMNPPAVTETPPTRQAEDGLIARNQLLEARVAELEQHLIAQQQLEP